MMDQIYQFKQLSPALFQVILVAVIFGLVVLINIFIGSILNRFEKKYADKKVIMSIMYYSINRPLRLMTWIIGLWGVVSLVLLSLSQELSGYSPLVTTIVKIALLFAVVWMLLRLKKRIKAHYINKYTRTDGGYSDYSLVMSLSLVATILIYILALFTFLAIVHFPLSGLAALGFVGGFGAYALAQANSILISNIFAGLALYFDRPFSVGDWISTQGGAVEGTVTKIGLRLTTIIGFDKRPIYVPNSIFNSTSTINPSRMENRRILQYVGVRYDDFDVLEDILKDIKSYLANHDGIDQESTTLVNLVNGSTNMGSNIEGCYGSSSINFMIYTFTKTVNWVRFQNLQDEVMLNVARIIQENNAEIAYTTSTLHIPEPVSIHTEAKTA